MVARNARRRCGAGISQSENGGLTTWMIFVRRSNTRFPIPRTVSSLGPATLSVWISCAAIHRVIFRTALGEYGSHARQGRRYFSLAHLSVKSVPGSSLVPIEGRKITVAAESRTFHSVLKDRGVAGASGLRS